MKLRFSTLVIVGFLTFQFGFSQSLNVPLSNLNPEFETNLFLLGDSIHSSIKPLVFNEIPNRTDNDKKSKNNALVILPIANVLGGIHSNGFNYYSDAGLQVHASVRNKLGFVFNAVTGLGSFSDSIHNLFGEKGAVQGYGVVYGKIFRLCFVFTWKAI
jgi:hypothetical protein